MLVLFCGMAGGDYYLRCDPKGGAPEGQHRIAPNSHPAVLWPMGLG